MTQTPNRQTRLRRLLRWSVFCSLIACFTCQLFANTANTQMKTVYFDVPKGKAISTLTEAARQADMDIVFAGQMLRKVETPAVKGEYLPQEVFDLMLAGTSLAVFQHEKSGVYTVRKVADSGNSNSDKSPVDTARMKDKNKTISGLFKGLLALAVAGSPNLSAQVEADREDEVFELSPFSVDANDQAGYRATSTLAGTRIRTNLKDLGSAISVYTAEFMDDTAATDAASLLSYTTNAEVGGIQGNFSGATDGGTNRLLQTDERTNPQFNQRIRGLGRADLTRSYFLTDISFDSYNTDRVTVSRGPNSLLFGIGSPGGVINNSTNQAALNSNFGEVKIRLDNQSSWRGEFDINRSLVENRLALRVAVLNKNDKFKQDPAYEDETRFYGALNAVLLENKNSDILDETKFRMNFESGESSASPVETIPPTVNYHGWFEPVSIDLQNFTGVSPELHYISPLEGGTWNFQETYNPFVRRNRTEINTSAQPNVYRHIGIVYNDPNNSVPNVGTGDGLQGYTGLIPWNVGRGDTLGRTGLFGSPGVAGLPAETARASTTEFHANSPYAESFAIGFFVPTLQNTDVFDYRNHLYSGGIDLLEREFEATNFALEQSFFNNRLAVEVAYDKQHYESYQDFFFAGGFESALYGPYDIYVSIAEYLQNGQPNPNLGRAYTRVARTETRFSESDRETFRLTAFTTVDFRESAGLMRHLGHHRITGLYNDYSRDSHNKNWKDGWGSNEFDIADGVAGTNIDHFRRSVNAMVYTSDSLLGLSSIDDVRLNQMNISRPQPGDEFNVLYADVRSTFPTSPRTLATGKVFVDRYLNDEGIGRTEIEAKAFAWQSYFLDEHLVGLLGYREDDTRSLGRASEGEVGFENKEQGRWVPGFTRLSKDPSLEESGDTLTWSVVGRYPEALLGNLPGSMDLQFHYAESENFNPIGLRNNALGESIGQPTGTTKEYGFLTSFANNKYSVKVNWYETALNDINAGPGVNVAQEVRRLITGYRSAELNDQPWSWQTQTVNGDPANFPIQDYDTFYELVENTLPSSLRSVVNFRREDTDGDGVWDQLDWDSIPNLRSTQDRVAEGFEVEMVANPTSGWRILANISQQKTINSDTATLMASLAEEYNASLQASRLGELNTAPDGNVAVRSINELWLRNGIASIRGAKALDNTVASEQREWRFSGVTTYRFNEGGLKGFSVGGAARWEDGAATGYTFILEEESGVPIPDVSRPFIDDGLFSGDLWIGYERMLQNNKIDWRVQLNIRNAFGDNDDIPVKTNPDGKVAVIRIPNPRSIYLSNSFRF